MYLVENLIDEQMLRAAINSTISVRAFREYDKIHQNIFFDTKQDISPRQSDLIRQLINRDGRLDDYINGFLADHISWDMEHLQTKDYVLDVGSVVFLETMLRDEDGDPYIADLTEFQCLLDWALVPLM
jgi:hypothetical protein